MLNEQQDHLLEIVGGTYLDIPNVVHEFAAITQFGTCQQLVEWLGGAGHQSGIMDGSRAKGMGQHTYT